MTASLIAYAVAVSLVLALAGLLLEWLAAASQWPRRWVWAGLLSASVAVGFGVPLSRQAPAPVAPPVVASRFVARPDLDASGGPIRFVVDRVPSEAVPDPPPSRINPVATVRDVVVRVDSIARALWPIACAVLLVFYLAGHLTLARRRRQWPARDIGGVRVLVSRDIGPAVIGVLRPQIVLPEWTLNADRRALGFMLRHEQEHQRARDPLLIQLARAVAVVMPWNPAAWWMLSRLKLAIECDCDDRVLAGAADAARVDYGEVLLSVGTHRSARHAFLGPAMLERSSTLARRIVAMQHARLRFLPVRLAAAGATAVVMLAAILLLPAPRLRAAVESKAADRPATRGDVALGTEKAEVATPHQSQGGSQTLQSQAESQTLPAVLNRGYTAEQMREKIQDTVYGRLDQAAIDAAKKWLFNRPCAKDGPFACVLGVAPQTLTAPAEEVYQPGNGVTWPTLLRSVDPEYTKAARDAKIQGTVYLTAVVETDGTVGRIRVQKSLDTVHGLDRAAIVAASKWFFKPCTKDSKPVPCAVQLELDFRLDRSPSADAARQASTPRTADADVVEPGNGVTWPTLLKQGSPQYTSEAMREKIQGTVHLAGVVESDGTLGRIQVVKSLPYGLDAAAVDAASKWTFKPCTKDGKPVPCRVHLELDFLIDAARVTGYLWAEKDTPIPTATVQIRNTTTGQVVKTARTNATGEFDFRVSNGPYVIEYVSGARPSNVIAVGAPFSVARGETVATFVRVSNVPAPSQDDEFARGTSSEAEVTGLRVLRSVEPQYTSEAMRQKIQGEVKVQVVVGVRGTVERARVVESLDKVYGLDNSALEAAKKWLFEPGKVDGRPVPTLTTLTLTFRLH